MEVQTTEEFLESGGKITRIPDGTRNSHAFRERLKSQWRMSNA